MTKLYIFENNKASNLEPISLTRPTFDIRCGPFTFLERIRRLIPDSDISLIVRDDLTEVTQAAHPDLEINPNRIKDGIWLLGNVLWEAADIKNIIKNPFGLYYNTGTLTAGKLSRKEGTSWQKSGGSVTDDIPTGYPTYELKSPVVEYLWDILHYLPLTIKQDSRYFELGNLLDRPHKGLHLVSPEKIHIASPEKLKPAIVIDATSGPVIIEEGVVIDSFVFLEGPLYIGAGSVITAHTKIRETIIGPECKIGGELADTVIQGYSNKVHDGHLGNAFVGEWVNLGAGTTNSNLKNNYSSVKVMVDNKFVDTEQLFIGLFIGDHSKTAIGTKLNTGTVIGPGCNIISSGFPPKTIQPFTWYVDGKHRLMRLKEFFNTARIVKQRRGLSLTQEEKSLYTRLFEQRKISVTNY